MPGGSSCGSPSTSRSTGRPASRTVPTRTSTVRIEGCGANSGMSPARGAARRADASRSGPPVPSPRRPAGPGAPVPARGEAAAGRHRPARSSPRRSGRRRRAARGRSAAAPGRPRAARRRPDRSSAVRTSSEAGPAGDGVGSMTQDRNPPRPRGVVLEDDPSMSRAVRFGPMEVTRLDEGLWRWTTAHPSGSRAAAGSRRSAPSIGRLTSRGARRPARADGRARSGRGSSMPSTVTWSGSGATSPSSSPAAGTT